MTLQETMQIDLDIIRKDMGNNTFTYNGETYFCIPSSMGEGKTLEMGGFEVEAEKVLTINRTAFTDGIYPQPLEKITYNNHDYRIAKIVNNGNSAFLRLFLVDYVKGV